MTQGLGTFMEGPQGGLEAKEKRRRGKAIDNILDRDADEYDRSRQSAADTREAVGGRMEDFNNPAEKEPRGSKGFNWKGGK